MKPFIAAAVLAVAVPRVASPGPGSSALAVEIARTIYSEETWNKTQAALAKQVQDMVEGSIRQSGGTVPPEFPTRLAEELRGILPYAEMIDFQAGLVVKYYTDDEMRALLAFYRTPLGQKAIRITPEVAQDVSGHVMTLVQQRLPAMMQRLGPLLQQAKPGAKAPTGKPGARKTTGKTPTEN